MKLQAALEAEKMQPSDILEKEKQNMTHTERNLNSQPAMKTRLDDRWDCKGSERTRGPLLKDNEHRHESHATEDHHKEELLTNTNLKDDPGTSVSDEHQPGHGENLTERRNEMERLLVRSKASKENPNLEVVACNADIESPLSPGMAAIETKADETRSHVTMHHNLEDSRGRKSMCLYLLEDLQHLHEYCPDSSA